MEREAQSKKPGPFGNSKKPQIPTAVNKPPAKSKTTRFTVILVENTGLVTQGRYKKPTSTKCVIHSCFGSLLISQYRLNELLLAELVKYIELTEDASEEDIRAAVCKQFSHLTSFGIDMGFRLLTVTSIEGQRGTGLSAFPPECKIDMTLWLR
jgi:hypothetical protein